MMNTLIIGIFIQNVKLFTNLCYFPADFVYSKLSDNTRWWIGGNDLDEEGPFVWSDGTPWSWTDWFPGKLLLSFSTWHDIYKNNFLCVKSYCAIFFFSYNCSENFLFRPCHYIYSSYTFTTWLFNRLNIQLPS